MKSSYATLSAPDGDFTAYLAFPEDPASGSTRPGIVLLQEIFGVNANIRGVAERFAAQGFIVVAPDLFWRQEPRVELDPGNPEDRPRAGRLMAGLDQTAAVRDALVAAEYLRSLPNCTGKVGAVGYCLGGKLAYLLAMEPQIDAAVSYYGVAIQGALDRAADVRCRLLLHIANDDHLCPPEAQEAIRKAVRSHSPLVELMEHPGTSHAFARIGGENFDAEAAGKANTETDRFLLRALAR